MGFMDKLKEFGKKAAKGALTMASKDYGTVSEGTHKLCKLSTNSTLDKLHFIKLTDIQATYDIKEDIKTFTFVEFDTNANFYKIKIYFNSGEDCCVILKYNKDTGSALPTPEQRIAAHFKDMADLIENMTKRVPAIGDDTKKYVNTIMRFAGRKEF